jgi:transcriptional regulator with XRE-family HTH domain
MGVGAPMAKRRKKRIEQDEVVRLFAARLKEVRSSRGMTQVELGKAAHVTASYIWRLESGGASPGIDLVARLAKALGTTAQELMPETAPPDTTAVLRDQARALFEALLTAADRETLLMLNPLLAQLATASERRR